MPSYILAYFHKHKSLIEENLLLCADPKDAEAVHNLRLSIKRLRVLARLAEELSEGAFDAMGSMKKINKLFRRAGRLRDLHVLVALSTELPEKPLPELADFTTHLQAQEKIQRNKFELLLHSFKGKSLDDFGLKLNTLLTDVSEKKALTGGHQLLTAFISEIRNLFHGGSDEKRLHNIRTRLKDINYLNNIFEEQLHIEEQIHISLERLKEVGELAGSWHDCLNFVSKLENFMLKHPDPEYQAALKEFISTITQRKQDLSQELTCVLINEMRV
ncbi:MAG: CHAD domain-containing protein [Bacteroidetes bacterium]|nr:CHAD domain-containing protein [Bacteroidota bacterium]